MNPLVNHHFPSWNCATLIVNPQFSDPEKGADRILPRWCMPWMRGKMKPGCSTLLVWPYLTLLTMTPTRWPLAPRRWEMGILNDGSGDTCDTQPMSTNHLWYGMKWGFPIHLACRATGRNWYLWGRAGGNRMIIGSMQKHSEHAGVQEQACGALANLGVHQQNMVEIAQLSGIELVIASLKKFPTEPGVQEKLRGRKWVCLGCLTMNYSHNMS